MSIHGKGVQTRVQECPISTKDKKQPNSAVHNDIIRSVGKGHKKIHAMDSYVEDHRIYLTNFDIHITLFLHSGFSYFLDY